jgi:excisionase family DNA binding protein
MPSHRKLIALADTASCPLGLVPDVVAHLTGMNAHELEPLMGVEELADYLGVPVQTVYDWRCSGTAPRAFKFGKRLKFAVADVAAWMAAHQEATVPGPRHG